MALPSPCIPKWISSKSSSVNMLWWPERNIYHQKARTKFRIFDIFYCTIRTLLGSPFSPFSRLKWIQMPWFLWFSDSCKNENHTVDQDQRSVDGQKHPIQYLRRVRTTILSKNERNYVFDNAEHNTDVRNDEISRHVRGVRDLRYLFDNNEI